MPENDIAARKGELRSAARERRSLARQRALATGQAPEDRMRSALLAAGLLARARVVAAYLAIGDEIDALDVLEGYGGIVALPVMVGKGQPLAFRQWTAGDPLVERMWGIREPAPEATLVTPDLLLVPLLAFDQDGQRLGYGGGFYDRTLARLRHEGTITAIGVAFDEQEVDAVPHLDYDEPLDGVLTPRGLRWFEGA